MTEPLAPSTTPFRLRGRTQTALLGLVCFCVPGMWNSITSMAGGISDTGVASAATASLYACFATCSLLAPMMANTVGPRATLFAGTIGYVVYVLSLLLYSQGAAPGGLVIGAGALCGICAGLLWTAQGMLMLSYPTPELKGSFVALFWIIFNSGAVLGGVLSMALNFNGTAPTASPATFIVYMAVMVAGALCCLLLQPLDRVVRPDGSRVAHTPAAEVLNEMCEAPSYYGRGALSEHFPSSGRCSTRCAAWRAS